MVTSARENPEKSSERGGIVAHAREFLSTLPDHPRLAAARAEGAAIASISESLGLAPELVASAEIYPLVRDGILERTDLEPSPVAELADTIDGLVQLGRFSLPPDWRPGEALATQQSEALRKMLLAVVSDARLVLIRIAEQLHRLREAKAATPEMQRAMAIETREIYAALANRLGVWQLKWELEDLSLRYLEPETYKRIAQALKQKRNEREDFIGEVTGRLRAELAENGIVADITGRPKHIFSIWRKMQRKGIGLDRIFDIRAVRVLVGNVKDCYTALGIVHNLWSYLPGEFDDYIAHPKDNNYQSLHTAVIGPNGQTVEVQIRTHQMHQHAELGVAAHWKYKEGVAAQAAFDQKIQFLRQLLEPTDKDDDLLDRMRDDLFEDRVYAVSPKGDVVEMPANSTPLDFAYHVHTEVGHRCRGAKVNGRIVQLTYKVKNGDKIEIITGSKPLPSRDWLSPQLGYLASARSRAKVRNWFRLLDKDQHRKQGREILDRELDRLNLKDLGVDTIARQMKLPDSEALYVALGSGDLTPAAIATSAQQLRGNAPEAFSQTRRHKPTHGTASQQIAVSGVGDLMCNFARCCRPVPPENIVGYITLGRGVSIHRQDCGNYMGLHARHPERVIEVDWGESSNASYPAELQLFAYDRQGLLRDISTVLSDEKISIDGVQTRSDKQKLQAVMELSISVPGLAALSRVINRLEQLPNVTAVKRKN
ncbi:MAG: bifunctional (p)ppGpp synthetase/guanosine-3',5'-bis(diphosphate) 3'-pyrophosphohydrolase [Gammaproteobacteria bacterium]|nr:bifunctional (p)ppGpp synthetase/guanosine-3',5'-bis(diphosphate) 3'-pyrophosphohydrolase [Gammaproteobacteria bacterium]MDH4313923.1 bifunctional (p)ppGpp synthetase/guanosine-3',5'-bis(diphosphate) 3'-pyrophosphohydrolase [Gammaproteobacteria bacterium]MDH5213001.1 bifunctional (p)ppGpp synthetase/guanosine-3',5'-bis(diphosphate) 3'-pyrophosphohydrolase [Gammaproteobacteria bacterium]MDH5501488.1 bifunctional (p)ppGpp synthetase/guanosine-3',5'-bis(diphosphate) 3'-pyrophosphohydrolase [Gamm